MLFPFLGNRVEILTYKCHHELSQMITHICHYFSVDIDIFCITTLLISSNMQISYQIKMCQFVYISRREI